MTRLCQRAQCPQCKHWQTFCVEFKADEWIRFAKRILKDAENALVSE